MTDDGSFLSVTVRRVHNGWEKGRVQHWPASSYVRNYLLLHRPVNLVLPGTWERRQPEDSSGNVADTDAVPFTITTNETELDHFSGLLRNNLDATYPDDAFLATLPYYFHENPQDSFITLFNEGRSCRLGIVIDRRFVTSLSTNCESESSLKGFLERLRLFFSTRLPHHRFPAVLYQLSRLPFEISEAEFIECGSDDPAVLKAMGGALCSEGTMTVPRIRDAYPEVNFRRFRSFIVATALLFVGITAVFSFALSMRCAFLSRQVEAARSAYLNLLENNTDIRKLITTGDELSRKVLRINRRVSQPSTWGPFLHQIGTRRPDGLFLERMGSEPVPGSYDRFRIALAGWCKTETIATDFIKKLNASPLLSEVTLSSMERTGKDRSICRFKILCILSTNQR